MEGYYLLCVDIFIKNSTLKCMHHKYLGGQHKVDPFFYIHGIPMVHYMVYPWCTTWYTL